MKDGEKAGELSTAFGFQCSGAVVHSREHEPPGSISLAKGRAGRVVGNPVGCTVQWPDCRRIFISGEQGCELACGYDPRGFVTNE
jgi:hypothetical protein